MTEITTASDACTDDDGPDVALLDWRAERVDPPLLVRGERKVALRNGRALVRDASAITTLCLHQTAVRFGAARGESRIERALDVAAHAVAFGDGWAVLSNPVAWQVNGGNGWNPTSVHLEIEGRFPGLRSLRKPHHDEVTPLVIATARLAMRGLVDAARAEGCDMRHVVAHRQSSATRRADPGEELWQALEPYARELGLTPLPSRVLASKGRLGLPIPREWSAVGVGRY